jgi:uncharacterized protein YlxW (UPF0749 family)
MMIKAALVGALCFIIGLFSVSQFGATDGLALYVSPKAAVEYKVSIESEKKELESIKNAIEAAKEQLTRYEAAQSEDDFREIIEELSAEVSKYKMFSGYEAMRGNGVIVLIDDGVRPLYEGEDINNVLVHDLDIIMIINDLKRNGAEAISVNGQRVIDRTEISCSGYTVRINGQVFARPFVIKAIGDGIRMSSSLISAEGYGTLLVNFGVIFEVELAEDIVIPGYPGRADYKYMINTKEV